MLYVSLFSKYRIQNYTVIDSLDGIQDPEEHNLIDLALFRFNKAGLGSFRISSSGSITGREIINLLSQLKIKDIRDPRLGYIARYPSLVLAMLLLKPEIIKKCSIDSFNDFSYILPVAQDIETLSYISLPKIARSENDDYPIFYCPSTVRDIDRSVIRPVNKTEEFYDPLRFDTYLDRTVLNSDGRKRNKIRIKRDHYVGIEKLEFDRIGDQYSYFGVKREKEEETLLQVLFNIKPTNKDIGDVFIQTNNNRTGSQTRVNLGKLSLSKDRLQIKFSNDLRSLNSLNALHCAYLLNMIGIHLAGVKANLRYTLRMIDPDSGFVIPDHWSKVGIQVKYNNENRSFRIISLGNDSTRKDPVVLPSGRDKNVYPVGWNPTVKRLATRPEEIIKTPLYAPSGRKDKRSIVSSARNSDRLLLKEEGRDRIYGLNDLDHWFIIRSDNTGYPIEIFDLKDNLHYALGYRTVTLPCNFLSKEEFFRKIQQVRDKLAEERKRLKLD